MKWEYWINGGTEQSGEKMKSWSKVSTRSYNQLDLVFAHL